MSNGKKTRKDYGILPFKIESRFNDEMKAYELRWQIGGFSTQVDVEEFSQILAEFIAGDDMEVIMVKDPLH